MVFRTWGCSISNVLGTGIWTMGIDYVIYTIDVDHVYQPLLIYIYNSPTWRHSRSSKSAIPFQGPQTEGEPWYGRLNAILNPNQICQRYIKGLWFYIWDIKIDIDPFMVLFLESENCIVAMMGPRTVVLFSWGSVGLKKLEAWSEQNPVNHKKRTQEMVEMWRPNSVWPIARQGFSRKVNGQPLQMCFWRSSWSSFSSRKVTVWMGNHGTNTTRI